MKKRWLSLALALVFCLSLVPGVTMTARAAELGQTPAAADSAVTLYADFGGGFELLSALYFGKDVTEQTVQVDRPITALRVVKGVCYELNLDRLTLDGACPTGYERKLSAADNDLIQVADSMDFPLSGSGELVIAARAPVEVMGENCSFKFPQINRGPIVPGSFFYSYTLGSDPGGFEDGAALAVPDKGFLFASEMCYPDSGHPDAPMDIYVADDGETLYVFFEAFMDNTFDHGKDFAGVHVRCGDAVKTYKVHTTAENEHGRWRFGYTDSSDAYDWEHMCYLVEVPLADLETSDGALELAFEYYGTAGYQGADLLAVGIDGTFLVADAHTDYYWNNIHKYYPDAELLPAPGVTRNADGGDTTEGDWWITNNDGDFTLTLNGATLDAGSEARNRWDSTDRFPPLYTLGNLTIELAEGTTTTITNNADSTDNYGIDAYGQELIIQGAGTLRVSANWKPVCMNNTLTIRDGATVNAAINATHTERSWSDTSYYPAVDVFGLTVDNATLKATSQITAPDGGDDAVYAVGIEVGSTMHRLTVENNALVEASASGGNEAGGNCGILWYGEAARMHFSADEVTILEGGDAGSAGEAEALTTQQTAGYSTGSKPYVKLVTANEIPAYDLWVAGTQVTGANADDLSVIDGVTVGDGGYAKYYDTNKTLTIKNATITNSTVGETGAGIQYTGTGVTFTLEAAGTNTVSVSAAQTQSSSGIAVGTPGIYSFPMPQANLRVYLLDDATLDLSGGTAEGGYYPSSYGIINAYDGQVVVTGKGTVNASGGAATYSYGLHSTGEFFKNGTCTLNATGADSVLYSCGMYGGDSITITDGKLNAAGGTVTGDGAASYGIAGDTSSSDTITIANGVEVLAKGHTVALHKAPALSSGVTAGGSANYDGSGAVVYAAADNNTYKWFQSHDCPSKHLKDVDINAWYHEYVDYVVEKGLMQGVADDLFAPNVTTSRAMIVTILHRLEGKPAASGKAPFDDVVAGSWYADAVAWAEENEIVNGYGGGKFGPNDLITREQFAAIMYRYANFKGYNTSKAADLSGYADATAISDWALAAMKWANAENLITGRTTTTLVPRGDATRAEAAAILKRFIENVK